MTAGASGVVAAWTVGAVITEVAVVTLVECSWGITDAIGLADVDGAVDLLAEIERRRLISACN